jgi:uncharacterized protein (TIGR02246 family)
LRHAEGGDHTGPPQDDASDAAQAVWAAVLSKDHSERPCPRIKQKEDKDEMKKFVSWLFVAITAVSFGHALPARAQSKDEREIRALEDHFVAAVNAKNVEGIMTGYVPGNELFVFDLGLPRQHAGWDDYKKDWEDFFAVVQGPLKLDIKDLVIMTEGEIAYSHSIQDVIWTNKDGSPTEMKASVTDVYRKIDGKWLIVQEHLSVPIHIATGKAEMTVGKQ